MPKPIRITPAREAAAIAGELIEEWHTHLKRARIALLFTSARRRTCDRVRLGSATKLSALQRYLSTGGDPGAPPYDFVILIDEFEWQFLPDEKQRALVDHELSHCGWLVGPKGPGRWGLRGHDVEEFTAVIERHGLWRTDLAAMADAIGQLPLPETTAAREPEREPVMA